MLDAPPSPDRFHRLARELREVIKQHDIPDHNHDLGVAACALEQMAAALPAGDIELEPLIGHPLGQPRAWSVADAAGICTAALDGEVA